MKFTKKVLLSDIDQLDLHKLDFIDRVATLGYFTSHWHDEQLQKE